MTKENLSKEISKLIHLTYAWSISKDLGNPSSWLASQYQTITMLNVAKLAMENIEGDILEIGSRYGTTTVPLLELASIYSKKIISVDPYNGQQEGDQKVFNFFINETSKYQNFIHYRAMSQDARLKNHLIENHKFSFVFVDGLHYDWACFEDIELAHSVLSENGICCVDDTAYTEGDGYCAAAYRRAKESGKWISVPYLNDEPENSRKYQPSTAKDAEKAYHFLIKA
jgi:hypothetical protein